MKTAVDYAKRVGHAPTMTAFTAAISALMRADGVPHAPAHLDAEGRCLTCGKAILCPGVHTLEEIQEAGRRDNSPAGRGETFTVGTADRPVAGRCTHERV